MQNSKIFSIILLISLVGSIGGAYITFLNSNQSIPEELRLQSEEELQALSKIHARLIASQLGRTESVIEASAAFAKQIFANITQMKDVPSYYHDNEVIKNLGLTSPSNLVKDEKYGNKVVSYDASAYKIAPRGFDSDYQSAYLDSSILEENPLDHVSPEIKSMILESAKMDIIWKQLYKSFNENIWLYMGFEQGFHRTYPYHSLSKSYDPRVRPWYVGAVTGAKDVVVIIDKSGSMQGQPMTDAKDAGKRVIGTLGPNDRFTVLSFSGSVDVWQDTLEIAGKESISNANEFISGISDGGSTNINEAIITGIEILKKGYQSERTPVIIFLTDGDPTQGETNPDLIKANVDLANDIDARLFLFGLGSEVEPKLLEDLAKSNNGEAVIVTNSADLEFAMSRYSKFFAEDVDAALSWTYPFVDAGGQGLIVSASKSVVIDGELLGVVSADVSFNSLVDLINDFQTTESGRSFVIDMGGTTVVHPAFLNLEPRDWQEDEVRVPISNFEVDNDEFNDLVSVSQLEGNSVGIVSYGTEERVVAFARVGTTSMIYGSSIPLVEMLDTNTTQKLSSKQNLVAPIILGSIGLGLVSAMAVYKTILPKIEEEK